MYYGISFRLTDLGLSVFVTQLLYAAVEVPAKVATYYTLNLIGRRSGQAWSMIITGALIGLNAAIPTGDVTSCPHHNGSTVRCCFIDRY